MKYGLSLLLSFGICFSVLSQKVLMERDITKSIYFKKQGPSKNYFWHPYFSYTTFFDKGTGGFQAEALNSYIFQLGFRNNFRLTKWYIMGASVRYAEESFRLLQNDEKVFPNADKHKKEFIRTYNIGLEYFNRILFTQRESTYGIFLDLGIYGNYNLGSRHFMRDKGSAADLAKYRETYLKGLEYTTRLNYGLTARLGSRRLALVGNYRLSDWIDNDYTLAEPPKFSLGLELGLY